MFTQKEDHLRKPQVPVWISGYTPPSGWTNVFQLVPSNRNLYGTETLFGDWSGRTLLLAKDGAPTHVIRGLRDKGESQPWRHAQRCLGDDGGWRTNETLERMAASIPGGKLYGSATANLLYDDPRWSRALPGFFAGSLHEYLKRVLAWVLDSMPNLEQVACLGNEAWFLTCSVLGNPGAAKGFARFRDAQQQVIGEHGGKIIAAHALYHPAAIVSSQKKMAGWMALGATGISSKRRVLSSPTALDNKGTPAMQPRLSGDWKRLEVKRAQRMPQAQGRIRPQMVEILKRAGLRGATYGQFKDLPWRGGLHEKKLDNAMGELCAEDGFELEFSGRRCTTTVRWRLATNSASRRGSA